MAPWARRLGCVLACYAPIGQGGQERDFGDLPIRSEGRVVNTPLVFKGFFLRKREPEERKKRSRKKDKESGKRKRGDGESLGEESEARLEWRQRAESGSGVKKTMNTGGVENGL
ncbi:hypothetical protein TNCV_5083651 [Trichonephila clavipes]|uniref:Uncharacterized protein n=1 Tax=Trichonephila clavipes TaxID=2585209 RepID=A0A8X6SGU3_TRICX|nr:hypothetical protein TNCV_5083651 [Trichonephila clavipes]